MLGNIEQLCLRYWLQFFGIILEEWVILQMEVAGYSGSDILRVKLLWLQKADYQAIQLLSNMSALQ